MPMHMIYNNPSPLENIRVQINPLIFGEGILEILLSELQEKGKVLY